jgi:hypothetical protein
MKKSIFLAISSFLIAANTINSTLPATALPQAEIVQKLQGVPVFAITNNKGVFLQEGANNNGKTGFFTRVFMSKADADRFFKNFQKSRPKEAQIAKVTAINLSSIYQLYVEAQSKKKNVGFIFIPVESQVKAALSLMKKPYKNDLTAYGVPLFFVAISQKGKYYTLQRNNLTPLFFEQGQAVEWLNTVKQKDPKLAAQAQIKVNSLQSVIENMRTNQSPEQKQIVLIPSRESIEIIRKIEATQTKPTKKP